MQRISLLLSLAFVLSAQVSGQSIHPADLGDKIIDAFTTENFNAYHDLYVDSADFDEFNVEFAKKNGVQIRAAHSSIVLTTAKQFDDSMTVFL